MNIPPRHHSHTRGFLATAAVAIPAMLIGSGLSASPAQAGYTVTLEQVGTSVVATGTGSLDTAGLSGLGSGFLQVGVQPNQGYITTGPSGIQPIDVYTGFTTGPTSFGSGGFTPASSGSGDLVGINSSPNRVYVPSGYVSDTPLLDSATYTSQTFTSLGVTPGTYTWTWGTAADADSFTLQIGPAAVPAPLIGQGLPALLAVGGLLLGAKLLERRKRHLTQFG